MYEIDELASIVAMANEKEQLALTEDIRRSGQQEPAVLWQGRLVDGRCRQLACHTLGIELVVRHLDPKLTRDEVAVVVKSLNTRRNLTMTQKIVSAYRQQVKTKETNEEVAGQWAISPMSLKNMKYIAKNRPDLVTNLFNGNTVTLTDPSSKVDVVTSKVSTIAKIVKKQVEAATLVVDTSEEIEYSVDSNIKTEEGKEWYYFQTHQLGITDVRVRILLVEMANLKFKAASPSLLETLGFTMDSSNTSEESLEE